MNRIERLRSQLANFGGDALFISSLPDIRWACGFTGSNAVLIVRAHDAHLLTDGRYRTQAGQEVSGAEVHVPGYDLIGHVAEAGLLDDAVRVLFQADIVTVAEQDELMDRVPNVEWVGRKALLSSLVASKSDDEIGLIRAAQQVTDDVFEEVKESIHVGMTEQDVATRIVCLHLERGAERMAFDPIVASGPNSALPHARPTDRELGYGEVVLLDFGCVLDGYASDMTRVVAMGEPESEAREIYDVVLAAQNAAIQGASAGMRSCDIDALARDVIRDAGLDEAFSHGLGHGVGLRVHEWPRISYSVEEVVPEDVVVSIEPGVYLPGRFGVRIEDLVVLRKGGVENLTSSSKEWVVL